MKYVLGVVLVLVILTGCIGVVTYFWLARPGSNVRPQSAFHHQPWLTLTFAYHVRADACHIVQLIRWRVGFSISRLHIGLID